RRVPRPPGPGHQPIAVRRKPAKLGGPRPVRRRAGAPARLPQVLAGRLVLEQRVAVLAPLVGELGDRGHPLVVVSLDLSQSCPDPAGRPLAEGLGDKALLARRLEAMLLED